jgi:hypothetical protein
MWRVAQGSIAMVGGKHSAKNARCRSGTEGEEGATNAVPFIIGPNIRITVAA